MAAGLFDWVEKFLPKPKPVHLLKWKIPEARLTVPVEDAEPLVAKAKKAGAKFLGGGEFRDVVYAKQFGEGVLAYFVVRTDVRTEEERLFFEGYMLEEEERLGFDVESAYGMMKNLEQLGYERAFERRVTEWRFRLGVLGVNVFDIEGFGDFLELALPATKLAKAREVQQKQADSLLTKLQVKKDEAVPTDILTLQYLSLREGRMPAGGEGEGGGEEPGEAEGAGEGEREASALGGRKLF
jgi:adenylate cyclase class IV